VRSRTGYLALTYAGVRAIAGAPAIARDYWKLLPGATLRDVAIAVRAEKARHCDVAHSRADDSRSGEATPDRARHRLMPSGGCCKVGRFRNEPPQRCLAHRRPVVRRRRLPSVNSHIRKRGHDD